MRSLAAVGLIELTWKTQVIETRQKRSAPSLRWDPTAGVYRDVEPDPTPVERSVERRAVRLTPLGMTVVDRIRPILERGRRIRWDTVIGPENE